MNRLALAVTLALAAPGRALAGPPATLYVAGKLPLEDTLVIESVAPDGKVAEVFRGGAPTAWRWLDAHALVELFDDGGKGDAVVARIVDGKPDPQHAIKVDSAAWPAEAQSWSQYLAVHDGELWLVREPPAEGMKPGKAQTRGTRKTRPTRPTKASRPVYQRIDVTPHVVQRDPPAGGIAARDDGRAWLDGLPSVAAPRTIKVTRTRARIGRRTLGAVQCKPATGATTTFPSRTTQPLLRIDVRAVRFVSPTLPLYVASGMAAERPGGPTFDTAAFLGCTGEALHTLVWGGGDVFLSIAGAPGGAGFSADDHRKMQLWVDGRAVADLGVLLSPVVSPQGASRVDRKP
ncbi:MAG TPA: hypothetical protein VFT22_38795 [Kofleriaceae bacterium]|nr:hypothetical protein [Kofleriaceae bacterium]